MSSTGRGAQRKDHDKYYTPDWLVDEGIKIATRLLERYLRRIKQEKRTETVILEPCCGGGAIVRKMQEAWPAQKVTYFDISPDVGFPCEKQDFLSYQPPRFSSLTVSNPPYVEAEAIIKKAIDETYLFGYVVMLLRVNFFGGQKRSAWLSENMPTEMHVSPRRPSFTGKSTDSTEYAWFVWEKGKHPEYTKTYLLDTATARFRR